MSVSALGEFTTHRGDEWWYSDVYGEMDLDASIAPVGMSITRISEKSGKLTAQRLHHLLWATQRRFPEGRVMCLLSKEVKPLVVSLEQAGLIRWEIIRHPLSEEAILSEIKPPHA
jgi:hypothetical protein